MQWPARSSLSQGTFPFFFVLVFSWLALRPLVMAIFSFPPWRLFLFAPLSLGLSRSFSSVFRPYIAVRALSKRVDYLTFAVPSPFFFLIPSRQGVSQQFLVFFRFSSVFSTVISSIRLGHWTSSRFWHDPGQSPRSFFDFALFPMRCWSVPSSWHLTPFFCPNPFSFLR